MSAITSLSAQLKRLQVPQSSLLNDRKRVSFLYDPKEAANLDSESVFCLAMNGLEQLKTIDTETFESFELTLFNSSSISFERAIQTKEVNEKLNIEIRRFLIHLSPYFMLKSAHKVFEWLVYRYQIHQYNLNELFMCVLPYHETTYFVRALQLINFEATSSTACKDHKLWEWLIENQKKGIPLASTTLATHVFSDLSFLNFLIDFTNACLDQLTEQEESKHLMNSLNFSFSFLTKTLLQSVKQLSQIPSSSRKSQNNKQQESYFAQLLPFLFNGFKSDLIVYKQSSYLIVSFLFEKFKFNSETSNKTLFSISKGLLTFRNEDEEIIKEIDADSIDCIKSAILAMCLIVQSQTRNLNRNQTSELGLMNRNFIKKLVKNFSNQNLTIFVDSIDNLNETYKIDKFLQCLFTRLLTDIVYLDKNNQDAFNQINLDLDMNEDENELKTKANNVYSNLLIRLTSQLNLNRTPKLVEYLINSLFDTLVNSTIDENNNAASIKSTKKEKNLPNLLVEYHLCELISKFENKYPKQFDECLNHTLKNLNNQQRNYLLNTVSCRFSSFKCTSTFKYQQLKNDGKQGKSNDTEFNLLLALNHSNANLRANSLDFIRTEMDKTLNAGDKQKLVNLDQEFIKDQIESKLKNESSSLVWESILKFDLKLVDYLSVERLIEDESLILRLFSCDIISNDIDLNDDSTEMIDFYHEQNALWLVSRKLALDFLFTNLFKKYYQDNKELFFNSYIIVINKLFEIKSTYLLKHIKKTSIFVDLFQKNIANEVVDISSSASHTVKKFYTSSISVTKLSTGITQTTRLVNENSNNDESIDGDDLLNELFDQFISATVKYIISNKQTNNSISEPKCFEKSNSENKTTLLDFIIFEISVRLCAQSLFLTNASHYLKLSAQILTNLFCKKSNLKLKKSFKSFVTTDQETELLKSPNGIDQYKKQHTFCNFYQIVKKKSIRNTELVVGLYQTLFKSINIQMSNFVNLNSKIEIENILNQLYVHLCVASNENPFFDLILKKFSQSQFFNNLTNSLSATSPQTPTKISIANNSNISNSFLQFAFKFLIYSSDKNKECLNDFESASLSAKLETDNNIVLLISQLRTIQLFDVYLSDLTNNLKKSNENSMLNSLISLLTWCLCSSHEIIRIEAINLLEKINSTIKTDDFVWSDFIKKIVKHKQEIQIDGSDYLKSKCLNKIFGNNEKNLELFNVISQFLFAINTNKTPVKQQKQTFFSNYLNNSSSLLVLNKFKFCLLDTFINLKDEFKLKLLDQVMNLFLNIVNDDELNTEKIGLFKVYQVIVKTCIENYLITSKSNEFFIKNKKYFDYIIGYLNMNSNVDNTLNKTAELIRYFNLNLIEKLARSNESIRFFQSLPVNMQFDLVKCFFDIWLSNSSNTQTINNLISTDSIKKCLISFNLDSKHFLCIFNDRIHLNLNKQDETKTQAANTTKQMKKHLKQQTGFNTDVDWKCLKYLLEFIQYQFNNDENKMETNELNKNQDQNEDTSFVNLIPYMFNVLETVETALTIKKNKQNIEIKLNIDDELLNYLEIITLDSLSYIYKFNIETNKIKLNQSHFNIELLMQILQTKREENDNIKKLTNNDNDDIEMKSENLNVQEHVLLLLSEIAGIFPDKVLEHVLIMFVFVGNKLARKDDSFSFQIINKIIKTILPSIVNSINSSNEHANEIANYNNKNMIEETGSRLKKTVNIIQRHQKQLPYVSSLVCKILQSFVVALPHIPAHRKTVIFNQLLQIIGLNDYLWITIIQSIDYYLVQSNDLLDFTNSLNELSSKQQQIDNKHEKRLRDTLKLSLTSMISLYVQFEPNKIIQTSIYLVVFLNKYLNSLFETAFKLITTSPSNKVNDKQIYSHLACQLDNYNLLQMKYLAYNLLTFVSDLIVSEELLIKLAERYEEQEETNADDYNHLFQNFLEKILLLILKLSQVFSAFEQQAVKIKNSPNQTSNMQQQLVLINDLRKFHKAILNKSYDLMERTISLLDSKQFINAIQRLIRHDSIQIRRRMLNLLNNKLRKYEPSEQEITLLITMIDDLVNSLQLTNLNITETESMDTDEIDSPVDIEINNQTILFSIKLLCKRIGEQNPLAFVKVIKFLSENLINTRLYIKDSGENPTIHNINLLSSVLLCAGELCLKLKSSALIYLNQIMTFTLEIIDIIRSKSGMENDLTDDYEKENKDPTTSLVLTNKNMELLTLSCVSCLLKIVQNMAKFLSPFLPRLLFVSCSLSSLIVNAGRQQAVDLALTLKTNSNFSQIEFKLGQLRSSLASLIPLRLLAPILNDHSFKNDSDKTKFTMTVKNIEFYMEIVKISIKTANQEDLLSNIRILRTMFMSLFDMRNIYNNKCNKLETKKKNLNYFVTINIGKYENYVIEAFCELIFKLSEDLFRPIFFSLYEWATVNEPPKDRLITFYSTTLK
jgi:hypothetical protein